MATTAASARHARVAQEASSTEARLNERREEEAGTMDIMSAKLMLNSLCYNMTEPMTNLTATMNSQSSRAASRVAAQLETAQALCESRGSRLTPIRRRVLEILLEQGRSVKAYELLELIRDDQAAAAPPTVYRALEFLVEEGLVHRLDAINAWAACHDAGGQPHDLLVVCTSCGSVAELSDPDLTRSLAEKVAQAGFRLSGHETELRGLCEACKGCLP